MSRQGTYKNKKKYGGYEHNKVNAGFGAGPLRARKKLEHTYGECQSCHMEEDLNGGLCKFCLWMVNDKETGEDWYG